MIEEHLSTVPDEEEDAKDPVNLFIDEALAELVPTPKTVVDPETAVAALTEEDREVMRRMGSPMELVAGIIASGKSLQPPPTQADRSTLRMSLTTTRPRSPGTPESAEPSAEYHQLLNNLDAMATEFTFSWKSNCRRKEVIGRGGQGIVFLAEDEEDHELFKAVKVFSPKPYGNTWSYKEDMDRLAHVASLVRRIQVDNLVVVDRFGYQEGLFAMIMPWIDGFDLAKLLDPNLLEKLQGCVDEDRWKHLNNVVVTPQTPVQLCLKPGMAVNIIEKCLRALAALHDQQIIHGDIKPSNIMLDSYGSIRLVDIGSAFELSARPEQHTWTPRYAPPEILDGGEWTPQSDLCSLGYVLIELLCGQPAIECPEFGSNSTRTMDDARDRKLLEEKRKLPDRLEKLLPAKILRSNQLMEICRRMIDPDPRKRFASAEDALEGPAGTYPFLAGLTRADLAVYYAQEITRWLADVKTALR